jgi:hypothetical protein
MLKTEAAIHVQQRARQREQWRRWCADSERFARSNGWRLAGSGFSMQSLARGSRALATCYLWQEDSHRVIDHVRWFNAQRRPVAIVTMPYHGELAEVQELAERYGLAVQAPPVARSGWWYPGHTLCFAFVRPGTQVRWLPQQCDPKLAEPMARLHEALD